MTKAADRLMANVGRSFDEVASLLGGRHVLRLQPSSRLDIHDLLLEGLPVAALAFLVDGVEIFRQPASMEKALGISLRTFQRHREAPSRTLNQEQSGRLWEFAEILAKATSVLGSKQEAQSWMSQPAVALEQRRPLDLLATFEGRRLVEDLLERMEYGVYT